MTIVSVTTTGSATIAAPGGIVGDSVSIYVAGGSSPDGNGGGFVAGTIPLSAFPLTVVCATFNAGWPFATFGPGGPGYSGGGGGNSVGAGGSTGVLTGGTTLLIEAGGANSGSNGVSGGVADGGGGGGGYSGSDGASGTGGVDGGGAGGTQGGNGGASGNANAGGGGHGGGTNGGAAVGTAFGVTGGTGQGALVNRGSAVVVGNCFASATVVGPSYGQAGGFNLVTGLGEGYVTITYTFADPPNAPTVLSPSGGGFIDSNALGVTFSAAYQQQTSDTGLLGAVALSLIIDSGTVHYWNGTDFSSTSPVWVIPTTGAGAQNGEGFTVTVPPGVLLNGHTYHWSFACQESFADLQGSFATAVTFVGVIAPTVTLTAPIGVVTTATPVVSWTESIPGGDVQTSAAYVIFDTPQADPTRGSPLWSQAIFTAALSFVLGPAPLVSGQTYYGYLNINTGSHGISNHSEGTFTLELGGPATPTLTGIVTTEPVTGMPAAELSQVTTDTTYSGATLFSEFQVSLDSGATWADVLGGRAVQVVAHDSSVYDQGSPFNVGLQYRVRNIAVVSGQKHYSSWSNVVTIGGVPSKNWWLIAPSDLTASMMLHRIRPTVASSAAPTVPPGLAASLVVDKPELQGVFRPFGKTTATIVHGKIQAEEFDVALYFGATAEFDAFNEIRELQQVVLLKSDMEGSVYWVTLGASRAAAIISEGQRQVAPKRGLSVHCYPADAP